MHNIYTSGLAIYTKVLSMSERIPERTKRVHRLRREMDRIKREINALLGQPDQEGHTPAQSPRGLQSITCVGCGHDKITRFMEEDLELNPFLRGITLRGGLIQDESGKTRAWWATTLRITSVHDVAKSIRSLENLQRYLNRVSDPQLIAILHRLATCSGDKKEGVDGSPALERGIEMGLIAGSGSRTSLTAKGWELYVTLAHLVHNHVVKTDPEKAQLISATLAEKLGWIHGTLDNMEPYRMSMAGKMRLAHESGAVSLLGQKDVTEEEIRDFLYDNWHIWTPERSQNPWGRGDLVGS